MAGVRERAARVMPADIELPTIDVPQYVNEDGYEVDAQTFALALQKASEDLAVPQDGPQAVSHITGNSVGMDADVIMVEEEPVPETQETEGVVENAEPLLNLSESNVLHYSVVSARQHHLQHLLPHIFSHPPIPANARPRARPPPKGTFLYPTPPPLVHPLPHREYHAPNGNTKKEKASDAGSPAPEAAEGGESKRRKYGRKQGRSKSDESEAPAHEIECIARVTLSVGAISFPGTELWVGRFVQPRAAAPKPPRAKKVHGERKKASEGGQAKHAKPSNSSTYSHSSKGGPMRPTGGPLYSGYRPRPPPPSAQTGQARPPPAPPRAELSPDLIKRVNEAATQHAWLSQIIHKAARSQATKEELAKLGRVVNRLKEGKDVGEGADDGMPSASNEAGPSRLPDRPPQSVATTSRESQANPTGTSAGSDSLSPAPENNSDDDSDVDMKGPQQVGGGGPGGVDPALNSPDPTKGALSPMPTASKPQPSSPRISAQPSQHRVQSQLTPHVPPPSRDSSSFASPPPAVRPPTYARAGGSYQPHPDTYAAYGINPPSGLTGITPPGSASPYGMAPPPPRPTYHLPPPFLVVAFKEAPTEKFQLPLGSLSYISRVGEKEETPFSRSGSVPSPPIVEAAPPTLVDVTTTGPTIAARKPTRATISKEKLPSPPLSKVETPLPDPAPAPDTSRIQTRPGLPTLTGASPPNGTVLISTFVPRTEWVKPDWTELATRLPFGNPNFERPIAKTTQVKLEHSPEPASDVASTSDSPRRHPHTSRSASETLHKPSASSESLPVKGRLLNIATESFFPDEGDVHAVTIRLSDVTDQTWQRLKTINGMVTTAEMKSLSEYSPHLMPPTETTPAVGPPGPHFSSIPPRPPPFTPSAELRFEYAARKKTFFRRMLSRVPARKFLQYRLPDYRPDIVEATTDKWGPRAYPISTKALANRDGDYDGQPISLEPAAQTKRGNKRAAEPDVTFELPVSLDQLDEMVAENALKGKKGKGMDGRKRTGKRWVAGTVCEGCGRGDKRVWRSGPGGTRTLCNSCGDKFTANELGPLVAPGAAHPDKENGDQSQAKEGPTTETSGSHLAPAAPPDVDGDSEVLDPTTKISEAPSGSTPGVIASSEIVALEPTAVPGAPVRQTQAAAHVSTDAPDYPMEDIAPSQPSLQNRLGTEQMRLTPLKPSTGSPDGQSNVGLGHDDPSTS